MQRVCVTNLQKRRKIRDAVYFWDVKNLFMRYYPVLLALFAWSCSNTIYVVRHAEKAAGVDPATMTSYTDPPLTTEGQERALQLKQILGGKNIRYIYSTNTLRTVSTARPLKELFLGMPVRLYSAKPDSLPGFLGQLRSLRRGDILVVGHSNTVDDLINGLAGEKVIPGDLGDREYDNLFILKRKGNRYQFRREKYGAPSAP